MQLCLDRQPVSLITLDFARGTAYGLDGASSGLPVRGTLSTVLRA
jgi:hypothetical protein